MTGPPAPVEPVDVRWGRLPEARPPIPVWLAPVFAATLAALLTFVVVVVVRPAGPLDQHDLAFQRDGLLLSGPVVPAQVGPVTFGGRPVVLLFLREAPDPLRLGGWLKGLPPGADPVVVVQSAAAVGSTTARVVNDPEQQLAAAVALPASNDGGPGIGYAVVDGERVVRYSTLDPRWHDNAFEAATVVGATR